jgi:hypothetical protein
LVEAAAYRRFFSRLISKLAAAAAIFLPLLTLLADPPRT